MHSRSRLLPFLFVLTLPACAYAPEVRSQFARVMFCPEGRVKVTPRTDLELVPTPPLFPMTPEEPAPSEYAAYPGGLVLWNAEATQLRVAQTPSPEIEADPERLALWRAAVRAKDESRIRDESRRRAQELAAMQDVEIFEAAGCGVDTLYGCGSWLKKRGPCGPIKPEHTRAVVGR